MERQQQLNLEFVSEKTGEPIDPKKLTYCERCGKSVDKTDSKHDSCDWVYGFRGWRQLGVYDG